MSDFFSVSYVNLLKVARIIHEALLTVTLDYLLGKSFLIGSQPKRNYFHSLTAVELRLVMELSAAGGLMPTNGNQCNKSRLDQSKVSLALLSR